MVALFSSEDLVDKGGYVAHVHRAVAVEVEALDLCAFFTQNDVDEGSDVAHVDGVVAVEVAGEVFFHDVFESIPRFTCFIGFFAALGDVEGAC